jgi:hypothetical protein
LRPVFMWLEPAMVWGFHRLPAVSGTVSREVSVALRLEFGG